MCSSEVQNSWLKQKKKTTQNSFFSFFKERWNCSGRYCSPFSYFFWIFCVKQTCNSYFCEIQIFLIYKTRYYFNTCIQKMSFKQMTCLYEFLYESVTRGTIFWNTRWWHRIALVSGTYSPYIFIQGMSIGMISGPNKYQQETNPLV